MSSLLQLLLTPARALSFSAEFPLKLSVALFALVLCLFASYSLKYPINPTRLAAPRIIIHAIYSLATSYLIASATFFLLAYLLAAIPR